jgi:DNA repair exonuclease SbcCD ATPase subunit
VDESKLFELAVLAHRLGCRSDQIDRIRANACWRPAPEHSVCVQDPDIDTKPYKHGKPHPNDLKRHKSSLFLSNFHKPFDQESLESSFFFIQRSLYFDIYPDEPRGIDELLQRAAEVGECDLIDDEYRPKMQGASEQLIRQEDELRATISELQERYDQLLSQESQCQRRIDDKKQEENRLGESIRGIKVQEQNLENRKTQLQTEVNQREGVKGDLDKEYQALHQKVADEQQKLTNINSKRETANEDLKRLEQQKENVANVIDSLESRKKELESEAHGLRSQEVRNAVSMVRKEKRN